MFHHRSSALATNISALEGRLRALETELGRIGRTAGRRTSAGISTGSDHLGDAIASAVAEIADRFRSGRRLAGDEAARFGNEAAKLGNVAVYRMAREIQHHPLVTLAVAIGVGVLIGMAGRRH
jgi:ElaB/YqjD/DUF883 family membrane-anchored ribosome-binding protein